MIVVETLTPGHEFESASASHILNHIPIVRNRTCCDNSLVFLMLATHWGQDFMMIFLLFLRFYKFLMGRQDTGVNVRRNGTIFLQPKDIVGRKWSRQAVHMTDRWTMSVCIDRLHLLRRHVITGERMIWTGKTTKRFPASQSLHFNTILHWILEHGFH